MSFFMKDGVVTLFHSTFNSQAKQTQHAVLRGRRRDQVFLENYSGKTPHQGAKSVLLAECRFALARFYGVGNDAILSHALDNMRRNTTEDRLSQLTQGDIGEAVHKSSRNVRNVSWAHLFSTLGVPVPAEWIARNILVQNFLEQSRDWSFFDPFWSLGPAEERSNQSLLELIAGLLKQQRIPYPWFPLTYPGTVSNKAYYKGRLSWGLFGYNLDPDVTQQLSVSIPDMISTIGSDRSSMVRPAMMVVNDTDELHQGRITIDQMVESPHFREVHDMVSHWAKAFTTHYQTAWRDAIPFVESLRYLSWGMRFAVECPTCLLHGIEPWVQNELGLHLISIGGLLELAYDEAGEFTREYHSMSFSAAPNVLRFDPNVEG